MLYGGESPRVRMTKMKKTLPILDREKMPREAAEALSKKKTTEWSPEELDRIWQRTAG